MQDYWGIGKATKAMLPMIAVPTTAGTGSETQSFALITDAKTHVKMACGDKKASLSHRASRSGADRHAAAAGDGADGHRRHRARAGDLRHARRATMRRWRSAARRGCCWRQLRHVLEDPDDLEARSDMQLGACFAGLAIENSMLGAAHALANPLTADYGIVARPGDRADAAARDPLQRRGV